MSNQTSIFKILGFQITCFILCASANQLNAQNLVVDGKVIIGTLQEKNNADSVIVVLPDGTLAFRNLSFLEDQILELQGLKDIENNHYNVVKIGDQMWMSENLRATRYNDGILMPVVTDSITWSNVSTPAYTWYANGPSEYGAIYNHFAVVDSNSHNICPVGWHVPSLFDWNELAEYLGGHSVAGRKLKEAGMTHWNSNNTGNNESGFTALPGGYRDDDGTFDHIQHAGYWWTSTATDQVFAAFRWINPGSNSLSRGTNYKKLGYSVRCIKD